MIENRKKQPVLPRVRDGDPIEPRHFNAAYAAIEEQSRRSRGDLGDFSAGGLVAVLTGTITAASGTTLGTGSVRVWKLYQDGDNVKRADTGVDLRVYNTATAPITGIGKVVQLKRVSGFPLVDVDSC